MAQIIDVGAALMAENARLHGEVERLKRERELEHQNFERAWAQMKQAEARLAKVVDLVQRLATEVQCHYGFYDSPLLAEARTVLAAVQPKEEKNGAE